MLFIVSANTLIALVKPVFQSTPGEGSGVAVAGDGSRSGTPESAGAVEMTS